MKQTFLLNLKKYLQKRCKSLYNALVASENELVVQTLQFICKGAKQARVALKRGLEYVVFQSRENPRDSNKFFAIKTWRKRSNRV